MANGVVGCGIGECDVSAEFGGVGGVGGRRQMEMSGTCGGGDV